MERTVEIKSLVEQIQIVKMKEINRYLVVNSLLILLFVFLEMKLVWMIELMFLISEYTKNSTFLKELAKQNESENIKNHFISIKQKFLIKIEKERIIRYVRYAYLITMILLGFWIFDMKEHNFLEQVISTIINFIPNSLGLFGIPLGYVFFISLIGIIASIISYLGYKYTTNKYYSKIYNLNNATLYV